MSAKLNLPGRCLIVSESSEMDLAQPLRAELSSRGFPTEAIRFSEALHVALQGDGSPAHVIALLPRTPPESDEPSQLARMVGRLHAIAGLAAAEGTIVFVQFGGGRFGAGAEPAKPEQCCAAAFARSLHLERPALKVRVVDLAPSLPAERILHAVLREMEGDEPFCSAGHDAEGVRREPRARMQQPARYIPRPIHWSAEDVILVTGGAKGITAECALALARRTRARFALVGSSPAPKSGTENELTQTLKRFEAEGIACRYYSCNVSDADAMQALVSQIRAEMGAITGVMHGAALNRPRRLEQVKLEEALAEVTPKLLGAANLCRALADAPPKLFVGLTSIIGVTGMPGNAWYGFSNEALDLMLRRFEKEHPETAVLCVAYSVWGETGMGARMGSVHNLSKMGIGAIPTAEGIERFVQLCLCDPGQKQVVVSARLAGLDTWPIEPLPAPSGLRFIERILRNHPGVDLVARTRLTLARDLYLQDHNYNGSFLFPTVFGLEAMTQAAAAVTGTENPEIRRIENISLERPIVVEAVDGVEIEIRAEVLEEMIEGESMVRVGIRTEQTGFASDHFSATLVLGAAAAGEVVPPPKGEPLAIEPLTDLYGGLLFQGPRFQKMGRIYELDSNHTIFESDENEQAVLQEKAFAAGQGGRLLLGDPFFRDVMLQAGQVTIPREVCLPIRIERIERFVGSDKTPHRFVFAPFKVRHGQEYVAEIFATDEEGRVLEKLTGYWLRILEERPDNPTAEELAHPEGRDEGLLRQALEKVLPADRLPSMKLAHLPGLHALPRPERRQREQPLIEKALRNVPGMPGEDAETFRIDWLPSGKPRFEEAPLPDLDLSLAHDEHTCLCVVGNGPQGCDLTPIVTRSEKDWRALLSDSRMPLLNELVKGGDAVDHTGARIWAAVEAIRKATQAEEISLAVERCEGEAVFLSATNLPSSPRVLTLPMKWTLGPERMIALVLPVVEKADRRDAGPTESTDGIRGIPSDWHSVSVALDGPQGQPVQELRFVVSFQEASSISRHVPASRYLTWMGKMRELVMSGSVPQLAKEIATGEWGLVTNWGDVHIFGEVTANDVIQMRFWTEAESRGSEIEFFCDFWKVHADGRKERVAFGEQKATWVRLIGHGQVVPEPLPDYLAAFIASMAPRENSTRTLPPLPEPLKALDLGKVIEEVPCGPSGGRVLATETMQTTLEESNLVGNVYFANYFAWQGKVRDLFLHSIAPEYFRGIGSDGEMVCLRSRMDYLREAMPFDRIEVVMTVRSIRACGAVLGFEYYRLEPDGRRQKLSVGTHEVAWVRRDTDGIPQPAAFPEVILGGLQAKAREETAIPMRPATANAFRAAARHSSRIAG
ncbi:MAG TPA: SDR family NAD(P)-dependent oxidoreductase [Gemmataceae bacterium]|nr:SDR family NAD(P)-dependent oxidoreductase [Gemmataceae bacterium]